MEHLMPRLSGRLALALFSAAGAATPALAQLRVCAWNISSYSGAHATRDPAFKTSIYGSFQGRSLAPDIVVLQEISNTNNGAGATAFLNVLNTAPGSPGDWALAPWFSSPDTSLAFYYRTSKVVFLGQTLVLAGGDINGAPRDIRRYDVRPAGYSTTGSTLAVYADHMKAGSSCCEVGSDQARRLVEAAAIRGNANNLPAGWHFIFGGDTNIQSSNQDAYQEFVDAVPPQPPPSPYPNTVRGQFFDPIKTPGSWDNNGAFDMVHTQAPGSGGAGMDSRYDFLLVDAGLIDTKGFEYIGNATIPYSTATCNDPNHSYRAWGNDGRSFNSAIFVGTAGGDENLMVGAVIAQALVNSCSTDSSGGHLPVVMNLRVPPVVLAPAVVNLGTVPQNAVAQAPLPVANGGNVSLWTTSGIATLQYSLSGSSGVTVPPGTFTGAPGAAAISHTVSINTSAAGPFSGTVTITPTDADTPPFAVAVQATIVAPPSCYANCDGSTLDPVLNVADFTCFLQRYAAAEPYANCDGSTSFPALNVADFTCFLQAYASGCP
jgi:hypothetical protein